MLIQFILAEMRPHSPQKTTMGYHFLWRSKGTEFTLQNPNYKLHVSVQIQLWISIL